MWVDGQFNNPAGVAVASDGNVYVADNLNSRIQKFTSAGVLVTKWGTQGADTARHPDTGSYQTSNPLCLVMSGVGGFDSISLPPTISGMD